MTQQSRRQLRSALLMSAHAVQEKCKHLCAKLLMRGCGGSSDIHWKWAQYRSRGGSLLLRREKQYLYVSKTWIYVQYMTRYISAFNYWGGGDEGQKSKQAPLMHDSDIRIQKH